MLNKDTTGLLVVDIQGKLARIVHDSDALIAQCEKLIKGFEALGLPIVWLEQNPDKLGATVPELAALQNGASAIAKHTFNACEAPKVMEALQAAKVDTWLVCGIEAHICVYQTAMGLRERGFDVQLVSDCVASRVSDNKALAINKLASQGVALTSMEMCLYELVQDCLAPEFRQILSIVR